MLHGRVEAPADIFLAVFGSIGLLIFVSSLWQVVVGNPDKGALERSEGRLPLLDGQKEAVSGTIEPVGSPLLAPFSGRQCVAYEYDVKERPAGSSQGPQESEMSGWALTPSVIKSDRGDVRLLGFGLLSDFKETEYQDDVLASERAAAFLRTASFEEMSIRKIGAMVSAMDAMLESDAASARRDWKRADGEPDVAGSRLIEKVIGVGDTVTVVGIYDASRGGLAPKYKGKTAPIKLVPGSGHAMVLQQTKRPWLLLAFSVLWSGFAHAVIYVALVASKAR
jgi:hypothetical protein